MSNQKRKELIELFKQISQKLSLEQILQLRERLRRLEAD